jgi:plastocyanin
MTNLARRDVLIGFAATTVLCALPAQSATNHAVTIQGMKFNPADLTIKAGDTVTFTNMDGAPHTASADNGSFDTGKLNTNKSAALTFGAKGEFAYHCNIHPGMKAAIHVA